MANLDGRAATLFEGVRSVFPGSAMAWRRVSQLPLRATAESGRQSEPQAGHERKRFRRYGSLDDAEADGYEQEMSWRCPRPPLTSCKPSRSERAGSCRLNQKPALRQAPPVRWLPGLRKPTSASSPGHERAILNSATGIPPGPGIIPDGGRRRGSAISPCPSARVAVRAKRQAAPPKCSPCR
jgi:hypothetical protein